MYLRAVHAEFDIRLLRRFVRENPFGILVTNLPSPNFPSLQCTPLPWVLDVDDDDSLTELGTLRGHIAKPNPHSKALVEAIQSHGVSNGALHDEVTVLFQGPVNSYVTPKFYVHTKPDTGKVVPTWNYSAVQAYGKATILYDSANAETGLFLQTQVQDLTKQSEEAFLNRPGQGHLPAWKVSDAPTSFIELLKKNIAGIKIEITRLEGKFKMSQEMGEEDRQGVINGFESLETEDGLLMARTVLEREPKKKGASLASASRT